MNENGAPHQEAIQHVPDADSFDFRKSWEGMKRACSGHKWLIAGTTLVTLAVVVSYIILWPPVYVASVTIVGAPEEDMERDNFYQSWNVFRKDHLPDEAQMMTAAPLLESVVDDLGLTYDDVHHPFLSHAAYLWTESWVGKRYRRAKRWVLQREPDPYAPTDEQIERARTIHDFKSGVSIAAVPETNVGSLIVRGPSPRVSVVANTLIDKYLLVRKQRYVDEAQLAYESLQQETEKTRLELELLEFSMREFYTDKGLLLLFEKDKVQIAKWLELEAAILEEQSEIAQLENTLSAIDAHLGAEDKEITAARVFQKSELREALRDRLSQLELTMIVTAQRFASTSPEIIDIQEQIVRVRELIDQEPETNEHQKTVVLSDTYETLRQRRQLVEADLEGKRAGLAVQEAAAKELEAEVTEIPAKMEVFHQINREHEILEKKYMSLQDKLTMAAVSKATVESAPPSMRVLESAIPPEKPSWPNNKVLLLAGLLIGLGAGIALALAVDLVHARVNLHQLEAASAVYPIIAIVDQDARYARQLFPASSNGGSVRK